MASSLYVHIPFCFKRCLYCDFVSGIYAPEKASTYIKALKKELLNIPGETRLSTLYIGGGTPTSLSTDQLKDLLSYIFGKFDFFNNYEASIEVNPGTLDAEKLRVIHESGINRISIGVQSFNDEELQLLGRTHSSEEAQQSVPKVKDTGFKNAGIDLIYGIPHQKIDSWERTLETAVLLQPTHISTYELTIEKDTALHRIMKSEDRMKNKAGLLPAEEKVVKMYNHAIDYLTSSGYINYEISNFALSGFTCRHNINYWDRGEYYGIGLGAHSFISSKRYYNTENLDEYMNALTDNRSPVSGFEIIADEKALSEAVFLSLRKTGGLDIDLFSRNYKINVLKHFEKEIEYLIKAGLIEIIDSDVSNTTFMRLTRKGMLLSNEVFTKFLV